MFHLLKPKATLLNWVTQRRHALNQYVLSVVFSHTKETPPGMHDVITFIQATQQQKLL